MRVVCVVRELVRENPAQSTWFLGGGGRGGGENIRSPLAAIRAWATAAYGQARPGQA